MSTICVEAVHIPQHCLRLPAPHLQVHVDEGQRGGGEGGLGGQVSREQGPGAW